MAVVVGQRKGLLGVLVHHHVAEVERVSRELREPAHRMPAQAQIGIRGSRRVSDHLEAAGVRPQRGRAVAHGHLRSLPHREKHRQSAHFEGRIGELGQLADRQRHDAVVLQSGRNRKDSAHLPHFRPARPAACCQSQRQDSDPPHSPPPPARREYTLRARLRAREQAPIRPRASGFRSQASEKKRSHNGRAWERGLEEFPDGGMVRLTG